MRREGSSVDRRRVAALCAWFDDHARDLPWRRGRRVDAASAYRALVAEAMLQQTQVVRVLERYAEFLRRFPSARALAAADEQAVLAAWRGLGYYRRARSLYAAAQAIVERHGGRVPADAAALRELPGVGRYTAGAIASIVHGAAEPVVDGNVTRVLARWSGAAGAGAALKEDGAAPAAQRRAWQRAGELVALAERPGVLNEALMELGATVCTPRRPRCDACPVRRDCAARREGTQEQIPAPRVAAARRTVHHHAVVIVRDGRVLLEQRPVNGLWSRMWQPPAVEGEAHLEAGTIEAALAARGLTISRIRPRTMFEHQTTHRRVIVHVHDGATRMRRGRWVGIDELDEVPMSNAHRRVVGGS